MVRLSKEHQTQIFLTRNGDGETVSLPIEKWEKWEAEQDLLAEMLCRERSMLDGSGTADQSRMRAITEELLDNDPMAL